MMITKYNFGTFLLLFTVHLFPTLTYTVYILKLLELKRPLLLNTEKLHSVLVGTCDLVSWIHCSHFGESI